MYSKNFLISRLLKQNYIFKQKRNLFLCIPKYNQNIEEKKIYTLNVDRKINVDKKKKMNFFNNISGILEKELRKKKLIIILAFSLLAITVDIKYATCDNSDILKNNVNNDFSDYKDVDINKFKLKFEEIDPMDAFYLLKHKNKMHMIQYSANTPIEDRCFINNININSTDLDKRERTLNKGNENEKAFVNSFEDNLINNENELSSEQTSEHCDVLTKKKDTKYEKENEKEKKIQNKNDLIKDKSEKNLNSNIGNNLSDNNFIFAGVIDGHGGWVVAEIAKRSLSQYVKKQLFEKINKGQKKKLKENDIIESLREAYLNLDNDILKNVQKFYSKGQTKYSRIGACCLSVLIDNKNYYVSNVGDAKGILIKKKGFVNLNNIHNANQVSERKRLIEKHPNESDIVICKKEKKKDEKNFQMLNISDGMNKLLLDNYDACYVKGRLQPTRNFGDFYLKNKIFAYDYISKRYIVNEPHSFPYITANPEILKVKKNKDDEFIVLTSDGVSDFLNERDIIRIVKRNSDNVEEASKAIVRTVLKRAAKSANLSMKEFLNISPKYKRRFHDDMSVVIIKLKED